MNNLREPARPKKVDELKTKARKYSSDTPSGETIQDVFYGPKTENTPADGAGEFNV